MEVFRKASVVRLCSHHDKFLVADDNQETVSQERDGSSRKARWAVELSASSSDHVRLKSCHDKYLTASNMPLIIGMRGKKVLQSLPRRLTSSVEWEPIRDGIRFKLRTHYGQFLRANAKFPPWRGHVTHDVSHRSVTQDWILWDVEVLEHRQQEVVPRSMSPPPPLETPPLPETPISPPPPPVYDVNSPTDDPDSPAEISLRTLSVAKLESNDNSSVAVKGRAITYEMVNEMVMLTRASEREASHLKATGSRT